MRCSVKHVRSNLFAGFLMGLAIIPPVEAQAQSGVYKIAPGETVEVNIGSLPDRPLRAIVQADGTISLLEAGSVSVAGLTPAEFQSLMQTIIPTKLFHARTLDGKVQEVIVKPGEISTAIISYRPVYVAGDVYTPGAQAYLPRMTIRQAVAVAGGYSLLRARAPQTNADPNDLLRDYQSLWSDYTKEYFHHKRVSAELNGDAVFDMKAPSDSPFSNDFSQSIAQRESASLKITLDDNGQELAYLQKSIADTAVQIDTLNKREEAEANAVRADQDDLEKVAQLVKSGNLTNNRMADARRALLLSSSQRLATTVELMRTRALRDGYERQIQRNGNQRKLVLLNDLRDGGVRLADLEGKLRAAGIKLRAPGLAAQGAAGSSETVVYPATIARSVDGKWQEIEAGLDTEILPGDVINITSCGGFGQNSDGCASAKF